MQMRPDPLISAMAFLLQHTHTCLFNGPLSRTTRVSRYQKGKTNLDFTEARDSEWQWHQLGRMQYAPHSRQITTPAPHHSVFYRMDALPAAQPTASKRRRQFFVTTQHRKIFVYNYIPLEDSNSLLKN